MAVFPHFKDIIFHCVCVSHFLYPFTHPHVDRVHILSTVMMQYTWLQAYPLGIQTQVKLMDHMSHKQSPASLQMQASMASIVWRASSWGNSLGKPTCYLHVTSRRPGAHRTIINLLKSLIKPIKRRAWAPLTNQEHECKLITQLSAPNLM